MRPVRVMLRCVLGAVAVGQWAQGFTTRPHFMPRYRATNVVLGASASGDEYIKLDQYLKVT